jgi:hypothetical protein
MPERRLQGFSEHTVTAIGRARTSHIGGRLRGIHIQSAVKANE